MAENSTNMKPSIDGWKGKANDLDAVLKDHDERWHNGDYVETDRCAVREVLESGKDAATLIELAEQAEASSEENVEELIRYAESNLDVFRKYHLPIVEKIAEKVGTDGYDRLKFVELWLFWAKEAARLYKESIGKGDDSFSEADIVQAALVKERTEKDEVLLKKLLEAKH